MAILRGGKRIGGMDIRIGIPRGVLWIISTVILDSEIKQVLISNYNRKISKLCKRSRRFCRKSKYYVIFDLPRRPLTQVGADGMVMGGDFRKFS